MDWGMDTASGVASGLWPDCRRPVMMAAIKRSNRASLIRWAAAKSKTLALVPRSDPGHDDNAQELVRRGKTDLMFRAGRAAQDVALAEMDDNCIFADRWCGRIEGATGTLCSIHHDVRRRGTPCHCRLHDSRAGKANTKHACRPTWMGYRVRKASLWDSWRPAADWDTLNGTHQAAILWIEEAESELSRLDEAAEPP